MDIFFTRLNRKQYLMLILLGLACFYAAAYFSNVEGNWFGIGVISAITLTRPSSTSNKPAFFLIAQGLLLAILLFIAGYIQAHRVAFLIYLPILAIISGYIIYTDKQQQMLSIWMVALTILSGLQLAALEKNLLRTELFLAAYFLCALLSLEFPSSRLRISSKQIMDAVLRNLQQLSNEIFECFSVLYVDNVYIFERRLHEQKIKYMQSMMQMTDEISDKHFISVSNRIFEELIDCSQLRWRVTDGATFELCKQEMSALKIKLNHIFNVLITINAKGTMLPLVSMTREIEALETNYQTILQIAAKDPFVFLLFISALKRLQITIDSLYHKDAAYVAA